MNINFDKQYKVLQNIYWAIVLGITTFGIFTIYQNKSTLIVSNLNFLDYLIAVSILIGILISFGSHYYLKKQYLKMKNYKGLTSKKLAMLIDATLVSLFLLEFPVIMNIIFLKKTGNIAFLIIAIIFLAYILFNKPTKTKLKYLVNK
jgi:hypothetical protein